MRRDEIRSELAFALSATEGTANQDFQTTRLNKLINGAYNREWERAKTSANKEHIRGRVELIWPKDSLTLELPISISSKTIIDIFDITDGEPGQRLAKDVDYFWETSRLLKWNSTTGPADDINLRIYYEIVAEALTVDSQEPELIPPQFHELLIWSAAVWARSVADDSVPGEWRDNLHELRLDFQKYLSRGKPSSSPTVVQVATSDETEVYY